MIPGRQAGPIARPCPLAVLEGNVLLLVPVAHSYVKPGTPKNYVEHGDKVKKPVALHQALARDEEAQKSYGVSQSVLVGCVENGTWDHSHYCAANCRSVKMRNVRLRRFEDQFMLNLLRKLL